MGGEGSGRRPGTEKIVAGLLGTDQPAPTSGDDFYLPNYSGVQTVALKTSNPLTSGSGSPGGNNTEVQFNDGGSFGGDSSLTWDKTTDTLTNLGTFEVGNASDTTLSRAAAGRLAVEGVNIVTTSSTDTLTNKTIDEAVISGTPDSAGEFGRDTTQLAPNWYDNGQLGTIPKVINVGVGTQTLTNSTASDQDFTSIYTLPANSLFTNKVYRISLMLENVTGSSAVTTQFYCKLGSTKVFINSAINQGDSITRNQIIEILVFGRAAAGAAAAVSSSVVTYPRPTNGDTNTVDMPVNLATNGTLAITPGVTYSGTGSTETCELQAWMVEELN